MATTAEAGAVLQPPAGSGQAANPTGQPQQPQATPPPAQAAALPPAPQETVESLVKEIEHLKLKLDEERRKLNDVARE